MKTIKNSILIILLIGMISCEKMDFKKDISGVWQCDGIGGGVLGGWSPPYNFSHLKLRKNCQYYVYENGTLKISGKYSMFEYTDNYNKYSEPYYLKFEGEDNSATNFPLNVNLDVTIINKDTLLLGERNIDGLQYYFTRK